MTVSNGDGPASLWLEIGADPLMIERSPARDPGAEQHHQPQTGGTGPAKDRRTIGPLQRGTRAVRLRRLARPAGAAAGRDRLRAVDRAQVQGPTRRRRRPVHRLHRRRRHADAAVDHRPVELLARGHPRQAVSSRPTCETVLDARHGEPASGDRGERGRGHHAAAAGASRATRRNWCNCSRT